MTRSRRNAPARSTFREMNAGDVTVTARAADKVRSVAEGLPAFLRLAVAGGGCGGFQYQMALATEIEDGDTVFSSEEITILVDPLSLPYLQGSRVDFEDGLSGHGFKVENPNASGGCGCGQSFRVDEDGCPSGLGVDDDDEVYS